MPYQVPQDIDSNKIFLVRFSELDERLDAQFYRKHFDFQSYEKLSSVAKVNGGKRIPLGKDYSIEPTAFLYLRVTDIQDDGFVDFSKLRYIDEETYQVLKRYEIFDGDLAISIAGTIGKVVVIKNIPENTHVILTENCAKIALRNPSDILIQYLQIVLASAAVQEQIALSYIQTTIPKLGLDRINNLRIPKIPSLDVQQEIVDYYNSANENKRQREYEATNILNRIDSYLLEELGIKLPKKETQTLQERMFLAHFSEVIGGRIDPKSALFLGEYAKSTIYDNIQLKQIAEIEKGTAITSEEVNRNGQYPVIAGGQTSPYNHDKYNYEGNVITISASGAYSGFVWYHRGPIFASDCSVIYAKDEQLFMTEYISEVLKAQQSQIYMLQQGAGQPHVYPDDLGNLWIPVIPVSKQQEIVNYIASIRQQAETLQEEGKSILERAKKEVEQMIIGDTEID